jgi:hypothetical protein
MLRSPSIISGDGISPWILTIYQQLAVFINIEIAEYPRAVSGLETALQN